MDDDNIYDGEMPHPDLPTADWSNMAYMVYLLLVGGPWEELMDNADAAGDQNTVITAGWLMVMQQALVEEFDDPEKLEEMKNTVAKFGAGGVLEIFWEYNVEHEN